MKTPISDVANEVRNDSSLAANLQNRFKEIHDRSQKLHGFIQWQLRQEKFWLDLETKGIPIEGDPRYIEYKLKRLDMIQVLEKMSQLGTDLSFTYTNSIKLSNELRRHTATLMTLAQEELKGIGPQPPATLGGLSETVTKASPEQAAENEARADQRASLTYEPAPSL